MKIAVNTRLLRAHKLEGIGRFTHEICKRLVQQHPEAHFYFLFDAPFASEFVYGPNVTPLWLPPPARRAWLWDIWFDASLPLFFKAIRPDVFFSPDGHLPRNSQIPSVPVIHDLNFEHHPEWVPAWAARYYKERFPVFAQQATSIITVSDFSKTDIASRYGTAPEKVVVAPNAASEIFRPLTAPELTTVRARITQGTPYFFGVGALNPRKNLVRTIQAFDQWCQQTNQPHQLVLAGGAMFNAGAIFEARAAAAFPNRIHFLGRLEDADLAATMAASSGLVYASLFEGFGIPILEAFQCGIPVLTAQNSSLTEVGGPAAIYCDAKDLSSMAAGFEELAHASEVRIAAGFKQAAQFSWDASAALVWEVLQKAAHVTT